MFTSVLTLALFLKFYGVSFLSRVSRRVAERAAAGKVSEAGWLMRGPQVALAGGCILLGLAPQLGYWMAYRAVQGSAQGLAATLATVPPLPAAGGTGVTGPAGLAILSPLPVAVAFGLLLALAIGISMAGGALRRKVEPWLCGYAVETDQMRYGARNLYREVLRYFPWVRQLPGSTNGNGHERGIPQRAGSAPSRDRV